MKKLLLLLAILGFAFTLTACTEDGTDEPTDPVDVSCEEDPDQEKCEPVEVTCEEDPTQEKCEVDCEEDPDHEDCEVDPVTLTFDGVMDITLEQDDVFNVLEGVIVNGSDGAVYTDGLSVETPDCYIDENNLLNTSTARTCIVEYSAVGAGSFVREQITVTIVPPVLVYPDDFPTDVKVWNFDTEADLEGWGIYTAGGGAIDMSIEDGAMKLVTASGGQRYETRLDFQGLQLEEGVYYYWQFDAKSDIDGKMIHLNFGQLLPSDPWFAPFKVEGQDFVTLTTEWETYSIYFTAQDIIDYLGALDGGPLFEMGNIEGSIDLHATIWMDNIIIASASDEDNFSPVITGAEDMTIYVEDNVTFDPMEGVTVIDNVDGDLSANVILSGDTVDPTTPGAYFVSYVIFDSSFNSTRVERWITVVSDTEGPEVLGADDVTIEKGAEFDLTAGVTAVDGRDGAIDASTIVVGGDVLDVNTGGVYNVTYTVSDSLGNETVHTRVITVEAYNWAPTDLVTNGTFDAGYWNPFYADWTDAYAHYSVNENGELVIDIATVGPDFWSVLVEQANLSLTANTTYRLTFDAMSSIARDIEVELGDAGLTPVVVSLTETMTTYTVDFTVGDADVTAIFKALMGNTAGANPAPSVITLDNIKLEEFDGTAVVADSDLIMDGAFDTWVTDGWTIWSRDWDPVITSSLSVQYNEGVFRYDGLGDAHWQNQFNFDNVDFVEGQTYKITFKAKSDVARGFSVSVYDGAQDFRSEFVLGTEFATYSHTFTYDSTVDLAKLSFELGAPLSGDAAGSVFWLDDVMVYEASDEVQPFWMGYGMDVVETEGVATVTYDVTGNWWESNVQGALDSFDGTNNAVNFTFTGEAGHDYLFKVEGAGGFNEVVITADGTEQVVQVPLLTLDEAARNQINLFIVFDQTGGAGTLVLTSYELVTLAAPDPIWNAYGTDATVVDNMDGTFTYNYSLTTQWWWDWSAQYEYGVYDGSTFNAIDFVFTGVSGTEYKIKAEGNGFNKEAGLVADGTEQTLTLDLSTWTEEQRSGITKVVIFAVGDGTVTPVTGAVTFELAYSTVAVDTSTLADMPNQDFTDTDISSWGTEGTLTLSHDAMGYMLVNVTELGGNPWDQNIGNAGNNVVAGNTYTVTYVIKTSFAEGRDVTFFVENTDAGYAKYFEEVRTLTNEFQTFTFTFTPTENNDDTKLGIFFGNMTNALIGEVVIDSITITETPAT